MKKLSQINSYKKFLLIHFLNFLLQIQNTSEQNGEKETNTAPDYKQVPYRMRKLHSAPQIENNTDRIRQTTRQNKPQTTHRNISNHCRQYEQQRPPHRDI